MSAKPEKKIEEASAPAKETGSPNPFDLESLRLPPGFEQAAGARPVIDTVEVRKPHKQEWFSVHPDVGYRANFGLIKLKEDRDEAYLVMPGLLGILESELVKVTIYTALSRNNKQVFLWPVNLPDGSHGRRVDAMYTIQHEHALAAMERPIRMQWVGGYHQKTISENAAGPVEWPADLPPFIKLLELAFRKTGCWVESLDHPVIKMLRGQ